MTLNQDGHAFSGVISVGETLEIHNKIKLLEKEIEQIKLTVAGLTHGQFSLNDADFRNATPITNEASTRSHLLATADGALNTESKATAIASPLSSLTCGTAYVGVLNVER